MDSHNVENRMIDRIGQNYNNIRKYFDKLNNDKKHFLNSNDVCTPIECVKEMVDSLPEEFWKLKNLKILDSCVGNGNFHAYIAMKTELKNLYFNEINIKRIKNLKKYFGEKINLSIKDFLKFQEKEEFDLVVSNPPYAKFSRNGMRASKNHNLSRDFIRKAIKITKYGGYILFIAPNNWMSYADRNDLPKMLSNYKFIELNIHGSKKYFPKIGSSFTWFLLKKEFNDNKHKTIIHNNYFIKDTRTAIIPFSSNFITLYYSELVRAIIKKTIYSSIKKYNVETTSFLHKYTKKELLNNFKTPVFKYRVIHTPSQTVWSKKKHKFHDGYKVFIPLTNQFLPFVDHNCGMTQSIAFIRCDDKEEANKIKKNLENGIFKFLAAITRYGNFNNVRVLQKFPLLKEIKLTKSELSLISKFNRIYYGKK